jgi:hypothetical protein
MIRTKREHACPRAPICLLRASAYLLRIKQLWVTRLAAAAGLVPQRALSQGVFIGCDRMRM